LAEHPEVKFEIGHVLFIDPAKALARQKNP